MGASTSKSTVATNTTIINNVTNSAVISTTQNCSLGQSIAQTVQLGSLIGVTNLDVNLNASQVSQVLCVQTADSTVDFSSNITTALQATLKASSTAGTTIGYSDSTSNVDAINNLITNVANTVNVSTLQTCLAAQFAAQGVVIGDITDSSMIHITIASAQDSIASCTQKQTAHATAVNALAQAVTIDASADSSSGFDLGQIIIVIIIVLAVLAALVILGPELLIGTVTKTVSAVIVGGINIITTTVGGVTSAVSGKPAATVFSTPSSTSSTPTPSAPPASATNSTEKLTGGRRRSYRRYK